MSVCRGCGEENLEMVLDLGIQPWGNHFIPISEWSWYASRGLDELHGNAIKMRKGVNIG